LIQIGRLETIRPNSGSHRQQRRGSRELLRLIAGEDNFMKILKALPERYAWKSVNTDEFRKLSEEFGAESAGSSCSGLNRAARPNSR